MVWSAKRMLVPFVVSCALYHNFVYAYSDDGRPAECDEILDPLAGSDAAIDNSERAAASIKRTSQSTTAIGISWSLNTDEDISGLCGFTIHWSWTGNSGTIQEKHHVVKQTNVTEYLVTGLRPGTPYKFYVLTYYATSHTPRSWMLITNTYGCNDDNPTFCDSKGTARCDSETGKCICKTNTTSGDKCDTCPYGFYMHSHGCTSCDHCPRDNMTSTGSCKPDPDDTMICDCIYPYSGKHCKECIDGFYWKDEVCVPCKCNNKLSQDLNNICEKLTGKCVCSEDTRGDFCELCAEGYHGDPIEGGCHHAQKGGLKALIVAVVMVVVLGMVIGIVFLCRRLQRQRQGKAFWIIHDHDKVNFSTLEEEPETEPVQNHMLKA